MLILPSAAQLRSATKTKPESIVVFVHVIVGEIRVGKLLALTAVLVDSSRLESFSKFRRLNGLAKVRAAGSGEPFILVFLVAGICRRSLVLGLNHASL
jgi:hypothetical protein